MDKLHLGCGTMAIPGWINIDIDSPVADVVLDLTRGLPFPDNSISCIFAEHVIEHFDYGQTQALLAECRRVLAPDGVIRLSTPDLTWLAVTYLSALTTEWGQLWQPNSPCHLINEGMRAWGHKFLFDRPQLHESFLRAGFNSTLDCHWHQSSEPELRELETRPFHNDLIVEARLLDCPPQPGMVLPPKSPIFANFAISPLLASQGVELQRLRKVIHEYAGSLADRDQTLQLTRQELANQSEETQTQVRLVELIRHDHAALTLHATALEAAVKERIDEAAALRAELKSREDHIFGVHAGVLDLQRHLSGLEDALQDRNRHLAGLEEGLIDRDRHILGLEARVLDLNRHMEGLEQGMVGRGNHIAGLEEGLIDRDRHILSLEAAVLDLNRHIEGLEQGMVDRGNHIAGLEAALVTNDVHLRRATQELVNTRNIHVQLQHQISGLENLLMKLRSTMVGRFALRLVERTKKK
jgi:predicted SAM-dependent methyltransferase